ncbi:Uncharacterised protein [Mycobacteroides abscessus subsp. abscessus]|nr:Uncharacterised protein [Mycobacteroides abscessus subsp. abscessus]
MVKGGNRFGQGDGVVLDGDGDRGGEANLRGDRAGGAQGHPGIQGAHIAVVGQLGSAGAGVGGLALDRDVGVLGNVEGAEPAVLGGLGGDGRRDAAVTGEQNEAVVHPPIRTCSSFVVEGGC